MIENDHSRHALARMFGPIHAQSLERPPGDPDSNLWMLLGAKHFVEGFISAVFDVDERLGMLFLSDLMGTSEWAQQIRRSTPAG